MPSQGCAPGQCGLVKNRDHGSSFTWFRAIIQVSVRIDGSMGFMTIKELAISFLKMVASMQDSPNENGMF
jgi:hypothetical protein